MVLAKLLAKWWRRDSWQHQVEHIARACAADIQLRLGDRVLLMTPSERHGYLHAKATPVVTAHLAMHAQAFPQIKRELLYRTIQDRVVELLTAHVRTRERQRRRAA